MSDTQRVYLDAEYHYRSGENLFGCAVFSVIGIVQSIIAANAEQRPAQIGIGIFALLPRITGQHCLPLVSVDLGFSSMSRFRSLGRNKKVERVKRRGGTSSGRTVRPRRLSVNVEAFQD